MQLLFDYYKKMIFCTHFLIYGFNFIKPLQFPNIYWFGVSIYVEKMFIYEYKYKLMK